MWFGVSLVMRSVHPNDTKEACLYEESVILVNGSSEEDARNRVQSGTLAKKMSFVAASGEQVEWVVDKILFVSEIYDEKIEEGDLPPESRCT